MKIKWLSQRIEEKINTYVQCAFEITGKTECVQSFLWNRIIGSISQDKIQKPALYIQEFNNMIFPLNWQFRNSLNRMRPLEQQKFIMFSQKLREIALGIRTSFGPKSKYLETFVGNIQRNTENMRAKKGHFKSTYTMLQQINSNTHNENKKAVSILVNQAHEDVKKEESERSYISSEELKKKIRGENS